MNVNKRTKSIENDFDDDAPTIMIEQVTAILKAANDRDKRDRTTVRKKAQ